MRTVMLRAVALAAIAAVVVPYVVICAMLERRPAEYPEIID